MRRLAALLAALVALGLMCLSLPWQSLECQPPACTSSSGDWFWGGFWWMILGAIFYLLVPLAVLTAILMAVLGLRDASGPTDAAVRAALGQSRGADVRSAAKAGAIDATVWIGGAFIATGIAHLVLLGMTNHPLTAEGALWLTRLGIGLVTASSLVAAHALNAMRAPKNPVQELLPESETRAHRRVSLGRRTAVLGALGAASAGVLVGLNLAFGDGDQAAPPLAATTATVAVWVLGSSAVAMAWLVLMPLARDAAPRIVGAAGRLTRSVGASKVGSVLEVRASTRWVTSSRVMVVLAGIAFIFGIASTSTASQGFGEYTPFAAGLPLGTGVPTSSCDLECAAARDSIQGEEGVGEIVNASSVTVSFNSGADTFRVALIDPADLDGVDDALAAQLREESSTMLMPPVWGSITIDDFDKFGVAVTGIENLPGEFPTGIGNRVWFEAQTGALDSTYFYAYPAASWTPDEAYESLMRSRSDGYAWTIEQGDRSDWIDGESAGGSSMESEINSLLWQNWLIYGVLGAVLIVPIAATATAAVIRRRKDDATMAALGASANTLRAAVVIEAVVTAGIALGAGFLGGAITHVIVDAGVAAIAGLNGYGVDGIIVQSLFSVDWWGLFRTWGITLAVFAVASWIASRSLRKLSPVEALRPVTEGALR